MKRMLLLLSIAAGLLIAGATLRPALGASIGNRLFVTPDGQGDQCTQAQPCSLATALTKLQEGDSLYLAGGRYTADATAADAVITLTLNNIDVRGGWDGAPIGPLVINPSQHPVIIDGENQRRGILIDGVREVSLSGLRIIRGNASGLGSDWGAVDAGGGLYARSATALSIANCLFQENVASDSRYGYGGGLALYHSNVRLLDVQIIANRASSAPAGYGYGGGMFVRQSDNLFIKRVLMQGNVASEHAWGVGGGMLITASSEDIEDAMFIANIAALKSAGFGGGLAIDNSSDGVILRHNLIQDNLAGGGHRGEGGGVYIANEAVASLTNNRIVGNTATYEGLYAGAGVVIFRRARVDIVGNAIARNDLCTTCPPLSDHAGGVEVSESQVVMRDNVITANDASGVLLGPDVLAMLTNNMLTQNVQSGLSMAGEENHPVQMQGAHNTIADNGAAGVDLMQFASMQMTNTLITGHRHDAGIRSRHASNLIDTAVTFYYGNAIDTIGPGAWNSVQDISGQDPHYLASAAGDYHLRADSPAIDRGLDNVGVAEDIDGEPRPNGSSVDIGADEYWPMAHHLKLPLVLH